MILPICMNQNMSTEPKQTIHKGWDTLPPLILPEKANAQPNITARQKSVNFTIESFQKAREIEEPKTFIMKRI